MNNNKNEILSLIKNYRSAFKTYCSVKSTVEEMLNLEAKSNKSKSDDINHILNAANEFIKIKTRLKDLTKDEIENLSNSINGSTKKRKMKIEEKNNLISIIKKYRQILVFEQAIRKLNEMHKQPINSRALIVSPAFKKELDQFVWENNK